MGKQIQRLHSVVAPTLTRLWVPQVPVDSTGNLRGYTNSGLSGGIPAELGSLSNLLYLHVADNDLSGEIPAELGSLSNLEGLRLQDNELSGCVPRGLSGQLNMEYSDLGDLPFCP